MVEYLKQALTAERREMLDEDGQRWAFEHMAKLDAGVDPFERPREPRRIPVVKHRNTTNHESDLPVYWGSVKTQ